MAVMTCNNCRRIKRKKGFTLVETLAAVFVAGMLSVFASAALRFVVQTTDGGESLVSAEQTRADAIAVIASGSEDGLSVISRASVAAGGVTSEVLTISAPSGGTVDIVVPQM